MEDQGMTGRRRIVDMDQESETSGAMGAAAVGLIAQKAGTVRTTADRLETAIEAEREAEAALLLAAVDAVRPALEVLSSRIPQDFEGYGTGQPNVTYFDQSGVALAEDTDLDAEEKEQGYVARVLYLLNDGRFAVVIYAGNAWPMVRGTTVYGAYIGIGKGTEEVVCKTDPLLVTARTVIEDWKLQVILTGLIDKLDRAEHGRIHKRIEEAESRAAKLRAILTLLGK